MINLNNKPSTSGVFLPPLKPSKNKLQLTNREPLIIENNLSKQGELYEIDVDKFHALTKQPRSEEFVQLASSSSMLNRLSNVPNSTPINFKWNTDEMPKLKVSKMGKLTINTSREDEVREKRKRLMFEQKCLLEEKFFEKTIRQARSLEFQQHANETFKKIRRKSKSHHTDDNQSAAAAALRNKKSNNKPDLWSSDNFKDINLKKEIILTFYTPDNRRIRYFQNKMINELGNDSYRPKPNMCLDRLEEKLLTKQKPTTTTTAAAADDDDK